MTRYQQFLQKAQELYEAQKQKPGCGQWMLGGTWEHPARDLNCTDKDAADETIRQYYLDLAQHLTIQ